MTESKDDLNKIRRLKYNKEQTVRRKECMNETKREK